ncbi:hypothetical protein NDU88_003172 [Pleurodeles waltl]|uniref:Uncharacterized protein n=1 Tax=Pleurodeles waltl TaxID=8319 RepID=A0AAV7PG65_PLEWA|nr:hypothetical protein NDU88_003172 [Pleurodeles waltl]
MSTIKSESRWLNDDIANLSSKMGSEPHCTFASTRSLAQLFAKSCDVQKKVLHTVLVCNKRQTGEAEMCPDFGQIPGPQIDIKEAASISLREGGRTDPPLSYLLFGLSA